MYREVQKFIHKYYSTYIWSTQKGKDGKMHGIPVRKFTENNRLIAFSEWQCDGYCSSEAITCEKCHKVVNIVKNAFRRHRDDGSSVKIPLRIMNFGEV